ncbi:conserved hypothetical protein [Paraburkholderia piptadeniae]|uniref:DUF2889 domain-containing protein n=1 Tax=Paraburkholderia piptadeniae TaxID=1701573 RepID=A0A1N7S374_9BURK|nr:DUF2889 domain-containing protein [Paraburkholderia piptadeniae]SIT41748.1 conserved hypothetical protein [Paraburkholderia piptadeniae]
MTLQHDDITREEIHHRRIDMHGCRRSDGLFEATAFLTDRKTHDFQPPAARHVSASEPIHDIRLTIVFDSDMIVRDVSASLYAHPYEQCLGGGDALSALLGLRIGAGWNSEVRKRLPSSDICTHIKELLGPLATTALQTIYGLRKSRLDQRDGEGKPIKLDSCHAFSSERELVRRLWPEYHRPLSSEDRT